MAKYITKHTYNLAGIATEDHSSDFLCEKFCFEYRKSYPTNGGPPLMHGHPGGFDYTQLEPFRTIASNEGLKTKSFYELLNWSDQGQRPVRAFCVTCDAHRSIHHNCLNSPTNAKAAIEQTLGDATHKIASVLRVGSWNVDHLNALISAEAQATYYKLLDNNTGVLSDHTLADRFERMYYNSVDFRFIYWRTNSSVLQAACLSANHPAVRHGFTSELEPMLDGEELVWQLVLSGPTGASVLLNSSFWYLSEYIAKRVSRPPTYVTAIAIKLAAHEEIVLTLLPPAALSYVFYLFSNFSSSAAKTLLLSIHFLIFLTLVRRH